MPVQFGKITGYYNKPQPSEEAFRNLAWAEGELPLLGPVKYRWYKDDQGSNTLVVDVEDGHRWVPDPMPVNAIKAQTLIQSSDLLDRLWTNIWSRDKVKLKDFFLHPDVLAEMVCGKLGMSPETKNKRVLRQATRAEVAAIQQAIREDVLEIRRNYEADFQNVDIQVVDAPLERRFSRA